MYYLFFLLLVIHFILLFVAEGMTFPHKRRRRRYSRSYSDDSAEIEYFEKVFAKNFPFLSDTHILFIFVPFLYYLYVLLFAKELYLPDFKGIVPVIWIGFFALSFMVFLYSKVKEDYYKMDSEMKRIYPNFGLYLIVFVYSSSIVCSMATVQFLNSALDFFKAEEKIVTIVKTDIEYSESSSRYGRKRYTPHYYVYFTPEIGGRDKFEVSKSKFGDYWKEDKVQLFVKKGFCGMPYLSKKNNIIKKDDYIRIGAEKNLPKNIKNVVTSLLNNMVKCPDGNYIMGFPYKFTRHRVTFTKPFYIGKFEVTQKDYSAIMGVNPSKNKGDNNPVENVSWKNAKDYCEILNKGKEFLPAGYRFDLPTEAQWEYACRAGTSTDFNNGKRNNSKHYICSNLDEVGWYKGNADNTSHSVGQKKPNAWGIYDMHGNVAEWCRDYYDSDFSGKDEIDPLGPPKTKYSDNHVVRGGGFWAKSIYDPVECCTSFFRTDFSEDFCDCYIGFRIALVSEE